MKKLWLMILALGCAHNAQATKIWVQNLRDNFYYIIEVVSEKNPNDAWHIHLPKNSGPREFNTSCVGEIRLLYVLTKEDFAKYGVNPQGYKIFTKQEADNFVYTPSPRNRYEKTIKSGSDLDRFGQISGKGDRCDGFFYIVIDENIGAAKNDPVPQSITLKAD